MSNSNKVLLIGWDAADWKIIHKLMDEGRMPNVQKLIKHGVMGNMATLFPSLSPMLWTTIATGKRPYKHGIHGFTEPTPDGKAIQPMTNISRKCKAIWNILSQNGKQSLVIGWWPSNPAEPINGVMVSDFFHRVPLRPGMPWNLHPKCVHPESALKELAPLRLHPRALNMEHILPFVPLAAEIDQDVDSRLSNVIRILCECVTTHRTASYLLQTRDWDFAAVYYDAIDHFCHGFMRYHPPQQEFVSNHDFRLFQDVVTQGYIYHDQMLGDLLQNVGDDVTVILMSDHGFHSDHLRPKAIPTEPAGPALEHRDYGIFVASGPGIRKDEIIHGASLPDITPTILTIFGLPVGDDMDGRPLLNMFEKPMQVETIPSWEDVAGDSGQHSDDLQLDESESKEALEQLIALGYIERPDDNSEIAIANCVRELDYNLARAYMDGGLYGEAIPLLVSLYNHFPLEFRFGLQLSNCLRAMNRNEAMEQLVNDLNSRWRTASAEARKMMGRVGKLARERRTHWRRLKKMDEENAEQGIQAAKLAQTDHRGKAVLFSDAEKTDIRKIRAIARGNPHTVDYLAASIAASKGDFEGALELMEKARKTKGSNSPGFQYQLGNMYLELNRLDDAQLAFEEALDVDQYYPNALLGLCRVAVSKGKNKTAIDLGLQAVGLKYHFPLAHYHLGQAKWAAKDARGAISSFETAIEQNPNFVEAHRALASVYSDSLVDQELARYHTHAAEELQSQTVDYLDNVEPIELIPSSELNFEELLPKLDTEDKPNFDRCLGQPRPIGIVPKFMAEAAESSIVIVTGLPRSGTSMMMQMLVAGGLGAYTDEIREADDSNPRGYFESEKVKGLANNNTWLGESAGKAVKVVAPLVQFLPQGFKYHAILMKREIDEILESQTRMLERLDRPGGNLTKERFARIFDEQLNNARILLKLHEIPYVEIDYASAVEEPAMVADTICGFLPFDLDSSAMASIVDPTLYREKTGIPAN